MGGGDNTDPFKLPFAQGGIPSNVHIKYRRGGNVQKSQMIFCAAAMSMTKKSF